MEYHHCLETLFAAGLEDIAVVLGSTGNEIANVIKGLSVILVWNNDPARVRLVDVPDPGAVTDMDTPEEYRIILDSYQQSRS